MKTFNISIAGALVFWIVLALYANLCHAAEVELSTFYQINKSEYLIDEFGFTLKAKTDPRNGRSYFAFLDVSQVSTQYSAQPLADILLVGLGPGISQKLPWGFDVSAQVGYWHPFVDQRDSGGEAMDNYVIDRYSAVSPCYHKFRWPDKEVNYTGAPGFKVGANGHWDITPTFSITAGGGYRWLRLDQGVVFSDPKELSKDPESMLAWQESVDFSGFQFFVGVNWKF